ncbi:MAG: hypothetical protein HYX51_10265 [Chloroflexi bacterium]|nr:hypothetical protein [Chloroflexota bacterium]
MPFSSFLSAPFAPSAPLRFPFSPRGVEHMPIAEAEAHILLLEPKGAVNTGALRNERTAEAQRLG